MLPNIDLNLIAVLVAAVTAMALGALWYSPLMFGNIWMKLSGMTKGDINKTKKRGVGKLYLAGFIGSLLMSYVLSFLIYATGSTNMGDGVKIGMITWAGFVIPLLLSSILWEGKPLKLYILNVTYWLISLVLMTIVISAWA